MLRSGSSISTGNLDTESRQVLTGNMRHMFTSVNSEFITKARAEVDRMTLHYRGF